jgi:hypothetical protein
MRRLSIIDDRGNRIRKDFPDEMMEEDVDVV